MTYIVESLFDTRTGNFDSASGSFDDPFLPSGTLGASMPGVSAIQAWVPALAGLLSMSISSVSRVLAIIPMRTDTLDASFEGSAVLSHEIVYGTQGTYTDNDPPAPAPYADLTP